ncbi:unnamed protein product [Blepharisma stoltei]|uniref:Uncharacterized protein n=1 Tax=Blepharisma stoltei TaxID=1481888 RepID=A0AAU9IVN0_9CILI|nr:unnamed protein product [Blepharisma stoltei]
MSTQASQFENAPILQNSPQFHPLSVSLKEKQEYNSQSEKQEQLNTEMDSWKQSKNEDISNESRYTEVSGATDTSMKLLESRQNSEKFNGIFEKDVSTSIKSFMAPEDEDYYQKTSYILNNISLNSSNRSSMLSEYGNTKQNNHRGRSICTGCIII